MNGEALSTPYVSPMALEELRSKVIISHELKSKEGLKMYLFEISVLKCSVVFLPSFEKKRADFRNVLTNH